MKKSFFCTLVLLIFVFFTPTWAQNSPCATPIPNEKWESEFSRLIKAYTETQVSGKSQGQLFTIPVIVHVIHGGQSIGTYPNLAQGQINSQIRVLNEDFGGVGYNSGNYPAGAFSFYASTQSITAASLDFLGRIKIANCQVQFCLATTDTLGNLLAEPGIERINYVAKGWSNPASFANINSFTSFMNGTVKPQSIWNITKYLNIWISDINGSTGLLGYATFPAFAGLTGLNLGFNGTPLDDGVWCFSRAFGSVGLFPSGTYSGSNNRGRTASHEVGHWLGLRHIWGDGACANDYCNDTPMASASNFGNPNYPYKITNCTGNNPNGEMFMNFMDYVNDNAKYMFSYDQSIRVQTAMTNSPYRALLGTHNLCSVSNVAAVAQFNIPNLCCERSVVTLSNTSYGTPVPTYTWSAGQGATISPNVNSAVATISFANSGTFVVTLSASNGTLSSTSKTIIVNPSPNLSIMGLSSVVCNGDQVMLLAGGANTYTWQPGNIIGNAFSYLANSTQTIQCTATGDGNCNDAQTYTISVSECLGLNSNTKNDYSFTLSPNPVIDLLSIGITGVKETYFHLEITNLSGKVTQCLNQDIKPGQRQIQIDISHFLSGVYFLNIKTVDGFSKTLKFIKQ